MPELDGTFGYTINSTSSSNVGSNLVSVGGTVLNAINALTLGGVAPNGYLTVIANGSPGVAGQALITGGPGSNAYWADVATGAAYQTTAGLSANVLTLTANDTLFVGTVSAANVVSNAQLQANLASFNLSAYQTTAGLAANVAVLTANDTLFVGAVSAANVVSNAQLVANLAAFLTISGVSANVTPIVNALVPTLTANDTLFVGCSKCS